MVLSVNGNRIKPYKSINLYIEIFIYIKTIQSNTKKPESVRKLIQAQFFQEKPYTSTGTPTMLFTVSMIALVS